MVWDTTSDWSLGAEYMFATGTTTTCVLFSANTSETHSTARSANCARRKRGLQCIRMRDSLSLRNPVVMFPRSEMVKDEKVEPLLKSGSDQESAGGASGRSVWLLPEISFWWGKYCTDALTVPEATPAPVSASFFVRTAKQFERSRQ